MNNKIKTQKMLLSMQDYYKQRDEKNVEKMYDVFFRDSVKSLLIGTDNGEWFRTGAQIKELFRSDWKHWGDLHIDTYDFSIVQNGVYSMTTIKGLLDFKDDHVWDINIHMIFEKILDELVCKVMQFTIPRNKIKPTVIINESEIENEKYNIECNELRAYNSRNSSFNKEVTEKIQKLLLEEIYSAKPYAKDMDFPIGQLMLQGSEKDLYFCASGSFKDSRKGDVLPFRIIGIGEKKDSGLKIINHVFSLPFVCKYG